jgi:pimeloyl-ACP methyl ester carboxylesterase
VSRSPRAFAWLLVLLAWPAWGAELSRARIPLEGGDLWLYRYRAQPRATRAPAVLLVPDVGLGKEAFDLAGRGLAPYLSARGREVFVWVPQGARPGLTRIADQELDAVLARVQAVRPGPVDLVAHGYAGGVVLGGVARRPKDFGRVVALAAPVAPEVPSRHVERLLAAGGGLRQLSVHPGGRELLDLLFARHGLLEGRVRAALLASLSDLGPGVSGELLGWMGRGELAFADGTTLEGRLAALEAPTLVVLPLRDHWAHPEHAEVLRELAPRAQVRVLLLSRLQYLAEDYTHLSVLHGQAAPAEVHAPILEFLQTDLGPARGEAR